VESKILEEARDLIDPSFRVELLQSNTTCGQGRKEKQTPRLESKLTPTRAPNFALQHVCSDLQHKVDPVVKCSSHKPSLSCFMTELDSFTATA
jgi:hypothetical protein